MTHKKLYNLIPVIMSVVAVSIVSITNMFYNHNNTNYTYYQVNDNLEIETCEFIDVVDGDTIKVLINNKVESVRFLNIDTPESKHPDINKNTESGDIATNFTKLLLKDKKILYLTKDYNDRDKYNRLLRLVWLDIPINDSKDELLNKCVNAILVKNKIAKVKRYNDFTYYKVFKEIENENHRRN